MECPSRPPREFTRPSSLPDSDDGGIDPGQALRNDGLNPPRPPTLGGRLRESGIQAAERVIAGAGGGAAAATRSVSEKQTINVLLRIPRRPPGLAPPPDEVPPPQIIGRPGEVEPLLQRAGQRAAEVERQAAQDIESFRSTGSTPTRKASPEPSKALGNRSWPAPPGGPGGSRCASASTACLCR